MVVGRRSHTVVERVDEWTTGEFLRSPDPKNGYSLRYLKDPDARIVIGFLNPIFHPEKPKRILNKWTSTFLGAMRRKCTVGWAELMTELVQRLIAKVRKGKKTGSLFQSTFLTSTRSTRCFTRCSKTITTTQ